MKRPLLLAVILALALLSLDRAGVLATPRAALGGLLEPLQIGWYRTSLAIKDRLSTITQIGTLSEENLNLREENDSLKADLAKLSEVEKENETLRQQLDVPETKGLKLLPAQVVGALPTASSKELVLNVGGSVGVKDGQVVLLRNVTLGKIVSVTSDRSTLRLTTDPASKILATTSRGARGVLVGQFQASAHLTKVTQDETVNIGDTVLTTGEGDWPAKLVLGEVTKVTKKDNELFQEAEVRPAFNLDRLGEVFIVVGDK